MTDPKSFLTLDRFLHEPARMAILTVLTPLERAEFKVLERLTGLSRGNLSVQTQKLEAAGYIFIHKGFRGRIPLTEYGLTEAGRNALAAYWRQMEDLLPNRNV